MTLTIYIYYIIIYTLGLQTPSETVFGDAVWDLKDIIYIYMWYGIYIIWRTAPPYHWKKSPWSVHQRRWRTATWWASASAAAWTPRPWPCACAWPASRRPWRGHGGAMAGPLGPWRSWGGVISPYSMDILGVIYKPGAAQKGLHIQKNHALLVGGFKHEFYFPFHIWDVILPID